MCKQRNKDLDDPWFDELDPVLKVYMYEHWNRDQEEAFEFARSQSILIGSFSNPSAAKDMLKNENPDFSSSNEEFEQSIKMIEENKKITAAVEQSKRKRQRRKIIS
jgi:hypothetical protein